MKLYHLVPADITAATTFHIKLDIKMVQKPFSSAYCDILHIPPYSNELMVPDSDWLLPDWTFHRLPVYCGQSISSTSTSSATFLKVVIQTPGGSVVYHSVHVPKVNPHTQSNGGKHNTHCTIWNQKALEDDILVVLRCAGMEHPK